MAERSLEDDLFGAEEGSADDNADADTGKNSGEGDDGGDDDDPSSDTSKDDDADGDDADGDDEDSDGSEDAPKDGAKAAKPKKGKAKDGEGDDAEPMVPKKALDSVKRRLREQQATLKQIQERMAAEDAEVEKMAVPDPKKEPGEYATYVARQQAAAAINDRLNFSEFQARRDEGPEAVDAAFEWANAKIANDPEFAKRLFAHASPYHYAVELHKADQAAKNGGGDDDGDDDPEMAEFKAWKAERAKRAAPSKDAGKEQQGQEERRRPKSLAQRASASGGGSSNEDTKDPFEVEFGA